MFDAKISDDGKSLVLTLPLAANPLPSKSSGKTLVCFTTGGLVPTPLTYNGGTITIGVNVMIPNTAYVAPPKPGK